MAVVILPDNIEQMIEEAGKPPLPEGRYLAHIVSGEAKLSENGKNSYGVVWTIRINNNPASIEEGWDTEAGTTVFKNFYTYIGKYVNGAMEDTSKGWIFTKMMGMFGIKGTSFDTKELFGRQLIVNITHAPGRDDREAMETNPSHVPSQLYLNVKSVAPYMLGDVVAPKLSFLEDGEDYADDEKLTPAEDHAPVQPDGAEPTVEKKKKRTPKDEKGEGDGSW